MRISTPVVALLLTAALAGPAPAQDVRVLASVSSTTIGLEESVTFTVEVRAETLSGVTTPDPPRPDGLNLFQSFPSTQQSMSIVNGVVSQGVSYTWTYRPSREGRFTFEGVTVRVADREYHTTPIDVEVVPQSQRPARPTPPSGLDPLAPFRALPDNTPSEPVVPDENDLFIRATPSTQRAVQNEQVLIRYELYFRDGIQLRQSRLTDSWDAEGFWREELDVDARPVPRVVVENGLRYNTITLKRAALFPTRAGDLAVDPLRIESEAQLPTRSRDPFAQFFLRSQYVPVELASPSLSIAVEPLPAGAPASFNGAVGQYGMIVDVDRTVVPVGGSVQVSITLAGTGNIATLASPVVDFPGAFERYDPQVETAIERSGDRLRGSKTFRYVFVARSNGEFEVPPVEYAYFDPAEGVYREIVSPARSVLVTGSETEPTVARATAGGLPVDDVAGPWLDEAQWVRTDRPPLHRRAWPLAVLVIPVLLVSLQLVADRRARRLAADPAAGRRRRAHPLAKRHLRRAAELQEAGSHRAFYEEVSSALLGFIGNRLDLSELGLTQERLVAHLVRVGVTEALCQDLTAFLDSCDRARFGPVEPTAEAVEADRDRAARMLVLLDDILAAT